MLLSGIQHYYFCKRQWALIHLEQVWEENDRTMEGRILHEKTDKPFIKEKRKSIIITRAVPVKSHELGFIGVLDTVYLIHSDKKGIKIPGKAGKWEPIIVEYKRGTTKNDERDIIQLVAQVMCFEEQFGIKIDYAYLYYFKTNHRDKVSIHKELREKVVKLSLEMHEVYDKGATPPAVEFKNCTLCSLYDSCLPRLTKRFRSIENYIFDGETV